MSAETVSAAAAIAAAVIAVAALYFTFKQASSAAKQTELQQRIHEDSAQPYVWADIRLHPQHGELLQFVVKNEGPTVATDVHLTITPPLRAGWMLKGTETDHGPHRQSSRFSSIPPGREMVWNLAVSHAIGDGSGPREFSVTVDALGPYGPVQNEYVLNVDDYLGVAATAPGTVLGLQKSMEESLKTMTDVIRKTSECADP
ncbi:hypothetical protein Y013_26470 (plasmid) [Rhodococcus pyridinivorans SB3094]|uniref:Uncharacterized protein n=1 Tax=Rhodococcus pyridinivorans SB3094 TaxID=1435356 RepID=V9XPP1_9NOCA|nr:hypothetical protein [Rhodococcus pyridinivorans]AHD24343.1 hypothetical protein Y013_26470 [Rhodococcus pyridinivorans SB3094]